jgi:hypothetical protein
MPPKDGTVILTPYGFVRWDTDNPNKYGNWQLCRANGETYATDEDPDGIEVFSFTEWMNVPHQMKIEYQKSNSPERTDK